MPEELIKGKICTTCHQWKPFSELDKDQGYKDGVRPLCKDCKKKKNRAFIEHWTQEREKGMDLPGEKECKDCHRIKLIHAFGKDNGYKSGRSHICLDCKSKRQKRLKKKWHHERSQSKNTLQEKTCVSCGKQYPRTHFTVLGYSKDGLSQICKPCQVILRKQKKIQWQEERRITEPATHKLCISCHRDLPVSTYYIQDGWKDGLSYYCKECTLQKRKAITKRWAEQHTTNKQTIQQKECIHCHQTRPIQNFYKNRQWKDGYSSVCIVCEEKRKQDYIQQWSAQRTTSQERPTKKRCIACHRILPASSFHSNKRKKDGLTSKCKDCEEKTMRRNIVHWQAERRNQKEDTFSLFPSFEKKCVTCHRLLPMSEFYAVSRRKDGLSSYCMECSLNMAKQSRKKRKATLTPVIPAEKLCSKCRQILPSAAFTINNDKKDGLDPVCRDCKNKLYKEYLHRPEIHEKMLIYYRSYSKKPAVRERQRKWARKYEKRPYVKQKRAAYLKKYYAKPEVKEKRKRYIKEYNERKKAQIIP